jgi:8-oxo-dGTP diphosphatase
MISEKRSKDFVSKFEATGCYILFDDKILVLKRSETDDGYQETWGTPGGKIVNETPKENIIREVKEETGIILNRKKLKHIAKTFVKYPRYSFIYHLFSYNFDGLQKVILSDEHSEYKWLKPKDALKLNLILDEDWCIKKAFKLS